VFTKVNSVVQFKHLILIESSYDSSEDNCMLYDIYLYYYLCHAIIVWGFGKRE
jgi:hypothetical protein